MDSKLDQYFENEQNDYKNEILRYLSFWPWFLISLLVCVTSSFLYLRYTTYQYESRSTIQILDESQDSEMALPTELTVFNRSLVNLQNEIGIFSSYSLHSLCVSELKSNIRYFTVGNIKTTEEHRSDWFDNYSLDLKIDSNSISTLIEFEIELNSNNELIIAYLDENNDAASYTFKNGKTTGKNHDLPFELTVFNSPQNQKKILRLYPPNTIIKMFRGKVSVKEMSTDSDQLSLKILYPNIKIAEEYLNKLVSEFDKDGVQDKQLQYKNTIDFVNTRSVILSNELEQIELRKQNFKQSKNLSDLKSDASFNIQEQYQYNSELFKAESQKTLAKFLEETISKQEFKHLPINIGFENPEINLIINEFNQLVKERDKYLVYVGAKNSLVLSIEKQLENYFINISNSIQNFIKSLDIKILALKNKESEYMDTYSNIPENEKILRSIDRELSIKEALFLLLLQKKEEASINFAVVRPTIKIIDLAITPSSPKSPNKILALIISIFIGLFIPFSILYILFFFDNKIHTKEHLLQKTNKKIKVIGEVPHILDVNELNNISNSASRSPLSESIRMITANLSFSFIGIDKKCKTILVTSSIKGEGKTLISVNTAGILCTGKNKVLLIGSDLRNPQIHKFLNKEKNILGLSDILYKNDIDNYKDYIQKNGDLDIILSGTIPPNPTELLSHANFEILLNNIKNDYNFIVIDSAPCLMVSDTLEISKLIDSSIYVVRANYTEDKLCEFILENFIHKRINNMNLVLNDVGVSGSYGYKYGYQYGYQYGYRYSYNYGYGYGYGSSEDS